MTRFFLIRHAATALVGRRIAGRLDGVSLTDAGRAEAARLAQRLAAEDVAAVYTSPRERARETARPLAETLRRQAVVAHEIDELDYGEWSGKTLAELDTMPLWRAFNSARSLTRVPNGESILELQARVVGFMERLAAEHESSSVALVTHAETVRAALAYYLGVPIDQSLRFDVDPASVSIVELHEHSGKVRCVNSAEAILG
ncbi:MAG TPA: histidine phosphatase family protein [Candidatus Binatia bacterium]|jgi:probable phosphoglycerate mutase